MSINLPKCTDLDYINFIISSSSVFSCTEAARCYSSTTSAPSHDCFTRLLQKQPSDSESLWAEVKKLVTPEEGYLIVDDTVLDKPYSEKIGFVRYQWSGKHHRTVKGIGLITLIWTDGMKILPSIFAYIISMRTEKPRMIIFVICSTLLKNVDLNRISSCLIRGMQA